MAAIIVMLLLYYPQRCLISEHTYNSIVYIRLPHSFYYYQLIYYFQISLTLLIRQHTSHSVTYHRLLQTLWLVYGT